MSIDEIVYELLADPNVELTRDRPVVRLPSLLASRIRTLASDQRAIVLARASSDVRFFAPDLLYAKSIVQTMAREVRLDVRDLLTQYDGTFSLAQTAALMFLARNADDASIAETVAALPSAARAFVARISAKSVVKTAVKNTGARQSSDDDDNDAMAADDAQKDDTPLVVSSVVARALYNFVTLSERATLAMVNRGFASLMQTEALLKYRYERSILYPLFDQLLGEWPKIEFPKYPDGQDKDADGKPLPELAPVISNPTRLFMGGAIRTRTLQRTLAEILEQAVKNEATANSKADQERFRAIGDRARQALAMLNRRVFLGDSGSLAPRLFDESYEKRAIDLRIRSYATMLDLPEVRDATLRYSIGRWPTKSASVRRMNGELIERDIYRPTNLFRYIYPNYGVEKIARENYYDSENLGHPWNEKDTINGIKLVAGQTRFIDYRHKLTDKMFFDARDEDDIIMAFYRENSEGPYRPALVGEYYIYAPDSASSYEDRISFGEKNLKDLVKIDSKDLVDISVSQNHARMMCFPYELSTIDRSTILAKKSIVKTSAKTFRYRVEVLGLSFSSQLTLNRRQVDQMERLHQLQDAILSKESEMDEVRDDEDAYDELADENVKQIDEFYRLLGEIDPTAVRVVWANVWETVDLPNGHFADENPYMYRYMNTTGQRVYEEMAHSEMMWDKTIYEYYLSYSLVAADAAFEDGIKRMFLPPGLDRIRYKIKSLAIDTTLDSYRNNLRAFLQGAPNSTWSTKMLQPVIKQLVDGGTSNTKKLVEFIFIRLVLDICANYKPDENYFNEKLQFVVDQLKQSNARLSTLFDTVSDVVLNPSFEQIRQDRDLRAQVMAALENPFGITLKNPFGDEQVKRSVFEPDTEADEAPSGKKARQQE